MKSENNKKEFEGVLKEKDPKRIIDKDNPSDLDDFFLILGLVFNDIKGICFFYMNLTENFRDPAKDKEVSCHMGEYNGISLYIHRLMIGLVREFLMLVKRNRKIIESKGFQNIVKKAERHSDISAWRDICKVAFDEQEENKSSFFWKLSKVRNEIVFHYDKSAQNLLRDGFVKKFFEKGKDASNKFAFYSHEYRMRDSRFYYCDGAVEEYMRDNLVIDSSNHLDETARYIGKINNTLLILIGEYLKK